MVGVPYSKSCLLCLQRRIAVSYVFTPIFRHENSRCISVIGLIRSVYNVTDTARNALDTSDPGNSRMRDPVSRSGIKRSVQSVVVTPRPIPRLSTARGPCENVSLQSLQSMSVFIRLWSISPSSASSHSCSKSLSTLPSQRCFSIMNSALVTDLTSQTALLNTLVPSNITMHRSRVFQQNTSAISPGTPDSTTSADRSIQRL